MDLVKLSTNYFKIWNSHNIEKLKNIFSEDCSLRDWNINVSSRNNVLSANQNIFDDVPDIKVEIISQHLSESTNTVVAEIIVHLNEKEKLKVVDIITFNQVGLISSIRAYQG